MKIKDLRQKTEKELQDLLAENRKRLGQLKFDLASKKLKNDFVEGATFREEVTQVQGTVLGLSQGQSPANIYERR